MVLAPASATASERAVTDISLQNLGIFSSNGTGLLIAVEELLPYTLVFFHEFLKFGRQL